MLAINTVIASLCRRAPAGELVRANAVPQGPACVCSYIGCAVVHSLDDSTQPQIYFVLLAKGPVWKACFRFPDRHLDGVGNNGCECGAHPRKGVMLHRHQALKHPVRCVSLKGRGSSVSSSL